MEKKKQSKQTRRKYDEGFKTEALRMVTAGRSTAEVARSLGIGENLLYEWRAEQKSAYSSAETDRDTEIESLRKALRQVEMERDILKKALVIFGRTT
jgi:transposase